MFLAIDHSYSSYSIIQMEKKTIGFIGGGRIVQALIDGLIVRDHLKTTNVWVSCPSVNNDNSSLKRYGTLIQTTTSNKTLCLQCNLIILAIKAKLADSICIEIANELGSSRLQQILFVSVIPGVTISTVTRWFAGLANVIRIMYNVTVAGCNGSYAISTRQHSLKHLENDLQIIFNRVAFFAGELTENELDIACALLGSGPAFFCTAVEGLADGAVKAGLSRRLANALAARTMLGCADLLVSTSKHPAELKDEVATPAGTTIYGLHELENRAVRGAFMEALMSAFNRAQMMSQQYEKND